MVVYNKLGFPVQPEQCTRIACIDGDLWTYDIPFAAEPRGREPLGFSFVRGCIETRIDEILAATQADGFSFFLTGRGNFRDQVATRVAYKSNRKQPKPYHFANVRHYLIGQYQARVANGWEADDELSTVLSGKSLPNRDTSSTDLGSTGDSSSVGAYIAEGARSDSDGYAESSPSRTEQRLLVPEYKPEYVCVSRDKDLRQVPGLHYGYRCGLQGEQPLTLVDELGSLELQPSGNKLKGDGLKFFYAQTLMGDPTDAIPGCPKFGAQRTYELLVGASTEEEMFYLVLGAYAQHFEDPRQAMLEQGRLAWMTREFKDNKPVLWELPF